MKILLFFVLLSSSIFTFAEDLAVTKQNIAGQKFLFEKGWYVITSPVEAWDYAIKNSESSNEAFARALDKIRLTESTFSDRNKRAHKTNDNIQMAAEEAYQSLKSQGVNLEKKSYSQSSKHFREAWKAISLGYIHYKETNKEDLESLKKVNQQFFGKMKSDYKMMDEAVHDILGFLLKNSDVSWKKHFQEGNYSFVQNYEKSGKRGNSLIGLWDILKGYASWTYHSILSPSSKTVYHQAKKVPYYTVDVISKTFIAVHNIVHSIGSNLYYSTKLGYGVIAPSVESGFLASLALTEAAGGAVSANSLKAAGLINKVAIKVSGPVVGAGQLIFEESTVRAKDTATVIIHGAEAVGEVVIDKIDSAVVLGYSALSQIPAQLLLTSLNSAILLIYDGPKLIIAKVSGDVGDKKITSLPVGTVLDLNKLKNIGFKVETLSEDPQLIKKVLKNAE